MGEARRRGTYEERKAKAIVKQEKQDRTESTPITRKLSKDDMALAYILAMTGYYSYHPPYRRIM